MDNHNEIIQSDFDVNFMIPMKFNYGIVTKSHYVTFLEDNLETFNYP